MHQASHLTALLEQSLNPLGGPFDVERTRHNPVQNRDRDLTDHLLYRQKPGHGFFN